MKNLILCACCLFLTVHVSAQAVATFEVDLSRETNGINVPVKVNIDAVTFLPDSMLSLAEVQGGKRIPVSFQIDHGLQRELYWVIDTKSNSNKKRIFELTKGNKSAAAGAKIEIAGNDGAVVIKAAGKDLLQYNFKTVFPPKGTNPYYKRSAFIHPLWSPRGQVLTRIQPPDHYHHYGIWNPWTHMLYKKDTLDFWNIGGKDGTVRFANFISVKSGPVFGEYAALHEHVAFDKGSEEVIINEVQSVKIYQPDTDYYIADVFIQMNCATVNPVVLLEYRYGGFGWRTTEKWDRNNSEVLTSEGKTRKDADSQPARWCLVQGQIDSEYAGVVMMSYPSNYNHPEPMRIWPENQYNRGDMFANFSPTRNTDWSLDPGKNYVLKYRLLVFNGKFSKEKSESAWQYFANPPKITIK